MTFQVNKDEGFALRKVYLGKSRRVVVKIGSAVLTSEDGLDLSVMANLARDISFLIKSGKEVILVSSGAVTYVDINLDGVNGNSMEILDSFVKFKAEGASSSSSITIPNISFIGIGTASPTNLVHIYGTQSGLFKSQC